MPGANKASTDLVNEWAAKEKVEVTIDYIPSQGRKNEITIAAEAQAKSGHDILAMATWWPHSQSDLLEPMNDVVEPLIKQNGNVNGTVEYLGKLGNKWLAVPSLYRQPDQGALLAHRSVEEARRHRRAGDVSGRQRAQGGQLDHGHLPQGGRSLPQGRRSRSASVLARPATPSIRSARFFLAFGAEVVDIKGNVVVKNDNVRAALEYYKKLMAFLPSDAPAWDDGSNNRWLISGKGALIMNPPSAWAVAKRDAPAYRRAMLDPRLPGGPEGPLCAVPSVFLEPCGISPRTRKRPRAC